MHSLFSNIRLYVLLFSTFLGISFYFFVLSNFSSERLQIIRLTQYFALTAVGFLYTALFVGPLSRFVTNTFIQQWLKARRALGVSAFFFGLLHGSIAFFGQLGGFEGLFYLNNRYLFAISLSLFGLLVLSMMALTSFDSVIAKMKFKRWKSLHRLVYLAGVAILIHAVMLGTHFQVLSDTVPVLLFVALTVLLLMHALLWDKRLEKWQIIPFRFGVLSFAVMVFLGFLFLRYVNPFGPEGSTLNASSFSVHTQHIQLAQQAQNSPVGVALTSTNVRMQGDPTKRYSVTFNRDPLISSGKSTRLGFKVTEASNGNPVLFYDTIYEKQMHLIVVNEELNYFSHIHPEFSADGFTIETIFPKDGFYRLYVDFQPKGAIEQQFGFSVRVGTGEVGNSEKSLFSESLLSTVDQYSVRLKKNSPFTADLMSVGKQIMSFRISDLAGNEVTNLAPYLSSFGHLVLINQETKDYIHVHPANLTVPKPGDLSGPVITFMPLGLYGPIKPGNYRVFLQLNPGGELKTFDFSIKVEP